MSNKGAVLLLCLTLCQSLEATVITIHPLNSNISCPAEACYSLSQLYEDTPDSLKIPSNTTVEFLYAQYQLQSTIVIRDVTNVEIACSSEQYFCELHCVNKSSLVFVNISALQVHRFALYNCGDEISQDLGYEATRIQTWSLHTFMPGLKAAIFAVNVHSLVASNIFINGSYGYGFLGINVYGNSSFSQLIISYSNIRSSTEYCVNPFLPVSEAVKCQGGNALFLYSDFPHCPDSLKQYTLTLMDLIIFNGLDPVGGSYGEQYLVHGSGLGIIMSQSTYDVDVLILRGQISSNSALASEGSNLYLRLFGNVLHSTVTLQSSSITLGNKECLSSTLKCTSYSYSRSVAFLHGAFSNVTTMECNVSKSKQSTENDKNTLLIENSMIQSNLGGGFFMSLQPSLIQSKAITRNIAINHCQIKKNICYERFACAMEMYQGANFRDQVQYTLTILNTTFEGNEYIHHELFTPGPVTETISNSLKYFSTNLIISFKNVTVVNCTFMDNLSPPLLAYDSNIYFEGINVFDSNTALFGGAIYLERNSFIFLKPNTKVIFSNNSAILKGGAIYIAGGNEGTFLFDCQIQVYDPELTPPNELGTLMKFINNTALDAGDALYGGLIDACFAFSISGYLYYEQLLRGGVIFDSITDFDQQPPSDSLISSDALQICFCTAKKPDCDKESDTIYQYPGEHFQVSIIAVGQRNGTVSAVVFTILGRQSEYRDYQQTGRTCSTATYKVASSHEVEFLLLSADNTSPLSFNSTFGVTQIHPILVQVNLISCETLTGFVLDKDAEICTCSSQLMERNMTCDIDTKIITREPPYWLSNYSDYLLLHDNCPYDYCKPTTVPIIMIEPNISDQCAFDRYGTLCGSCREGLSHVFGTSRCQECSNFYILLIIPFAVAGIVLVAVLFLLNLTVSAGTINGLIFYANMIKINESAFFPPGDMSPFRVFISWLNLDLGIETCFYNGMDSYTKTWLQFLFPLYLWLILGLIIVVCHYSTRMVQLFGKHSVEVLATVFLLSYTKLLRTIITVLSFTTLEYPDGKRAVWLYDGTYQFGNGRHLALLIFSVVFLLVIAIPYTLLIFLVQFLRRCSHIRFLQWITKLMPIFDAYLGPYKHKHGYWTGLLLVIRVVLVAVFAFNVLGNPAINLFVVRLVAALIALLNLGLGGVYKSHSLTALEIFYIVNLLIVASATSLVREINWDQRYAIYSSVLSVMLVLLATLVYHGVSQIKKTQVVQKRNTQNADNELNDSLLEPAGNYYTATRQPATVTVIDGINP